MIDYLIKNALVHSGLNEAPKAISIGVKGDRIVFTDNDFSEENARHVIDGTGMYLAPGFIDPHASTGFGYFFENAADHKLFQGITTEIFGNCGTSPAPVGPHLVPTMEQLSDDIGFPFEWRTTAEYFEKIEDNLQFNIATMVGHSTLRQGYLSDWHSVSGDDLSKMKNALAQAMEEGSLGMSTGLIYSPGSFAEMSEIIELAKVSKAKGGIYASHIRDERDEIEAAIDEALTIGERAEIDVLVSHLKAAEKRNWGKIPAMIERIENYNAKGGRATIDVYPYTAVSTKLKAHIPKPLLADGPSGVSAKLRDRDTLADLAAWIKMRGYDYSQMLIISNDLEEFYGKTVDEISQERGWSHAETIREILTQNVEAWIVYHCISEADMDHAMHWPKAMVCTDSWSYPINAPRVIGQPHPRSYGAFTTFLERYVLTQKSISWPEAFHKMSYLPAQFFGLKKRGQIADGHFADLVLLDPEKVKANATYLNPKQLSEGVEFLWVNGEMVIEKGGIRKATPGRVLRK